MVFSMRPPMYARGLIFYRQGIPPDNQVTCASLCCCCCSGCSDDEQEAPPSKDKNATTEKVTDLMKRETQLINTQSTTAKDQKK